MGKCFVIGCFGIYYYNTNGHLFPQLLDQAFGLHFWVTYMSTLIRISPSGGTACALWGSFHPPGYHTAGPQDLISDPITGIEYYCRSYCPLLGKENERMRVLTPDSYRSL